MDPTDAPKSVLRQWVHQRHQALLEIVMSSWQEGMKSLEPDEALLRDLREAGAGSGDPGPGLARAIDGMEAAPSQGEVLRALQEGLQPFAQRSALFIVKQGLPTLYAARGFDLEAPKPGAPVMPSPELEALLQGRLHALPGTGEVYASMLAPLGSAGAAEAVLLPLRLRRKAVALLLVDSGSQAALGHPAEVRALAHTAEACLSFLAGQKDEERAAPAPVPAPPAAEPGPGPVPAAAPEPPAPPEDGPGLDPTVRLTAERLARVLAGDIELYYAQKLAQGLEDGNVYAVLREELERSRDTFLDRFGEEVELRHRIFSRTIVQQLCGGDASRLGPAPWAPRP